MGHHYVFELVNNMKKCVQFYLAKSTDTASVLKNFSNFIETQGLSHSVISDQGTGFTSDQFKKFYSTKWIKHALNLAQYSQFNSKSSNGRMDEP